ncbi:MAG: SAM-dependent methyltransferase [Clostridia bacterium]|nr:SAM-dependent methyltransferase [Clostridia bacterium]
MTEKSIPTLDARLSLAASFVKGECVADIGTDHAYLPIYLILAGKCQRAIAADINEGPLERARINCARYGIEENVTFCLADGLNGLPLSEKGVTDIVICGMGGELIAGIIGASDYVKRESVRLILQPMSHPERLRLYLAENGFATDGGGMVKAQDKLYQCIVCHYDGQKRALSSAALELGEENITSPSPVFREALDNLIQKTERAVEGRLQGGLDCARQNSLLSELYSIRERILDNENN